MDLAGKTIVITGGARGLGAAMARRLAGAGSRLALVDLDESALRATATETMGSAYCGPRAARQQLREAGPANRVTL